jgi:DNA-binding GntR family transcriptional regulator
MSNAPKRKSRRKKQKPSGTAAPRTKSLTERAYELIRERIIQLDFLPRQYINEGEICARLDLSRTPVHEALLRLQVEGLVEIVPRRGVIIQPDSVPQVLTILDARSTLEPELARRAAEKATMRDIAELEHSLTRAHLVHGGGAIDGFVESDRLFHVTIATMTGNDILRDILKNLHERSTRFWYLNLWQTWDPSSAEHEHRVIFEAIKKRDAGMAAKAMRTHIDTLRERFIKRRQGGGPE